MALRKFTHLALLPLLAWLLAACGGNPLKINVSNIKIEMKFKRLDQDVFRVTPENIRSSLVQLEKNYGSFFDLYNREILAIGGSRDTLYNGYLLSFLGDPRVTAARAKSDSVFARFRPFEEQLTEAFRHYRYYFPDAGIPEVVTCISCFNQSIVTTPGTLGISLDNYLGPECRFYRQLGIPVYKRRNMRPEKLAYDAVHGWISTQFEYKGDTEDLVSEMIYQGKLLYCLDAMIPEGPDSLKIGFSHDQLNWCRAHESEMWSWLVERKLLFSGDRMEIVRFINPAPFTTPFGQKSPGRTGAWIGWQIVRSYMKKNPATTLRGLLEDRNYHRFLNESGYSPG